MKQIKDGVFTKDVPEELTIHTQSPVGERGLNTDICVIRVRAEVLGVGETVQEKCIVQTEECQHLQTRLQKVVRKVSSLRWRD